MELHQKRLHKDPTKENSILFQAERYDNEAKNYLAAHGDKFSQKYRDKFIRAKAFPFSLKGKKVLDAMCAFGAETGFLLKHNAEVEGLDISKGNAELYQKLWGVNCRVSSIHETAYPDNSFDVVYICGGLHHVLPLLQETIAEVYRILKPGGFFCFVEPNASSWINFLRKIWYRVDKRFDDTEEAIDYNTRLKPLLTNKFKENSLSYGGGIAYLLIAQSLILKTPYWVKKVFYRPFFALENFMNAIHLSPNLFFVCVWQKK